MTAKIDLVKSDRVYYDATERPSAAVFGPIPYLSIAGEGEPAGEQFVRKASALYPLAYGVKAYYKGQGRDFAVPKLEGLWWVAGDRPALEVPRAEWQWKLLLRLPDFVSGEAVGPIRQAVSTKKRDPLIHEVAFERIEEGECVQVLHVGPYATEPETIRKLLRFAEESGWAVKGPHHEIYLSDPRTTTAERVKTIIRYAVT